MISDLIDQTSKFRFFRATISFIFFLISSILLLASAWAMGKGPPHPPRYIRVAIIRGQGELSLTLQGPYEIRTLHTGELLTAGRSLRKARARPTPSGIKINELALEVYGVNVRTKREGGIYLNRRRFRGTIDIIREPDLTLLIVNELDVEDYLYGVLRGEVSHRWPIEALKAQAIAARTFALYQRSISADKDYDLTCDVSSQVYGGRSIERYWTNRAVNRTLGKVLTYEGELFPSHYHASSGGHTEDASQLWDVNLPPLRGVKDLFSLRSPHHRWTTKLTLKELQAKLAKAGYLVERISAITPLSKNRSGRIKDLLIVHTKGRTTMKAHRFRDAIGVNLIRSTNFAVKIKGREVTFRGLGWGHGVGLSQWGAYNMARKGHSAKEILKFYYPGAKVKKLGEGTTAGDL